MTETHFLVRVEPRDFAPDHTDRAELDEAMADEGFRRWVTAPGGTAFLLPPGEYLTAGALSRRAVLERARRAATATGWRCAFLVVEATGFLWLGLDEVPEGVPHG
jgi:hypothetical protein